MEQRTSCARDCSTTNVGIRGWSARQGDARSRAFHRKDISAADVNVEIDEL
jgi:hypothetical protein